MLLDLFLIKVLLKKRFVSLVNSTRDPLTDTNRHKRSTQVLNTLSTDRYTLNASVENAIQTLPNRGSSRATFRKFSNIQMTWLRQFSVLTHDIYVWNSHTWWSYPITIMGKAFELNFDITPLYIIVKQKPQILT